MLYCSKIFLSFGAKVSNEFEMSIFNTQQKVTVFKELPRIHIGVHR